VVDTLIKYGSSRCEVEPAPIRKEWVLEGNPVARNRYFCTNADNTARSCVWECTAGRFNWFYDIDETVCLLEGAVTIKDHRTGISTTLQAGDMIFFPAGSRAEWTVETYVRKFAFLRTPPPPGAQLAWRVTRSLRRRFGGDSQGSSPL
jgi:uncharacterized cupin superfamily protein